MDLRVLTGVFVTLFGIAVGMAGGDIQSDDLMDAIQDADFSEGLSGIASLQDLSTAHHSKPANTSITANLTSPQQMTLNVRFPSTVTVRLVPGTTVAVGDGTFQARAADDQDVATVTFHEYTGKILTANNLSFDGRAKSVNMDHMALNYSQGKKVAGGTDLRSVHLSQVKDLNVEFHSASGVIRTSGPELSLSGEQASIRYFRGELLMSPENGKFSYILDGHVHRAMIQDGGSPVTIGG